MLWKSYYLKDIAHRERLHHRLSFTTTNPVARAPSLVVRTSRCNVSHQLFKITSGQCQHFQILFFRPIGRPNTHNQPRHAHYHTSCIRYFTCDTLEHCIDLSISVTTPKSKSMRNFILENFGTENLEHIIWFVLSLTVTFSHIIK